jgi:hypothetical protein
VSAGILAVSRRAVGDVQQRYVAQPPQLAADPDRLVVGVGDDDHQARRDRAVASQLREQRARRPGRGRRPGLRHHDRRVSTGFGL